MIGKIINRIYETIEKPEEWNNLLKEISVYCLGIHDGGASIIPVEDGFEKYIFGSSDNKEAYIMYYNEWKNKSPLKNIIDENKNKNLYYVDDSFLSNKEIDFNPFYQDFLNKFGVRRVSNIIFKIEEGKTFLFSVQSPVDINDSDRKKIKLKMNNIIDSIKLSFLLSFKFNHINNANKLFSEYIKNQNYIIFSMDEKNNIVEQETNIKNYLKYGIIIKNRLIDLESIEDRNKFNTALKLSKEQKKDKFLKINNKYTNNMIIRVVYLDKDELNRNTYFGVIDKYVIITMESINKNTEYALRQFHLSPSQAKMSCLLAEGLSIREASLKMEISEGTARQNVKEIFARLEINSQNKLETRKNR